MEPDNAELTAAGVVEDYLRMPATEDHDFLKSALLLLMCSLHTTPHNAHYATP